MRSISEAALSAAKERWNSVLKEKAGKEQDFAGQLFALSDVIATSATVSRSLTDAARKADDRAQLASDLFSAKLDSEVSDILQYLVRQHWASDEDFFVGIEELGIETILTGADAENVLNRLEDEIYQVMRSLTDERELRTALSSDTRSVQDRSELARQAFARLHPLTLFLVVRAVERTSKVTLTQSLHHYMELSSKRNHHLVANVTAAVPLTDTQETRLASILTKKYGQDVSLHVSLEPEVIGGLRIHIGDDVIDGTLLKRVNDMRKAITQ